MTIAMPTCKYTLESKKGDCSDIQNDDIRSCYDQLPFLSSFVSIGKLTCLKHSSTRSLNTFMVHRHPLFKLAQSN